jgi:hypothetical protein
VNTIVEFKFYFLMRSHQGNTDFWRMRVCSRAVSVFDLHGTCRVVADCNLQRVALCLAFFHVTAPIDGRNAWRLTARKGAIDYYLHRTSIVTEASFASDTIVQSRFDFQSGQICTTTPKSPAHPVFCGALRNTGFVQASARMPVHLKAAWN